MAKRNSRGAGIGHRASAKGKRSLEAYDTPITWRELIAMMGAGPTDAGVDITAHNMLQLAAVWCAVRIISEAMGVLPLVLLEREGDHAAKRALGHPVYKLIHQQPNPVMVPSVFKETMQGHILTWGNAYAKIIFDGRDRPAELWPLLPNVTKPVLYKGQTFYETQENGGGFKYLYPEEVLHIPGLGFDGRVGYSVLHMARQALGLAKASERFGSKFFANGSQLGGVVMHPAELSDKALNHLRQSLMASHGGVDNAWRPMILEEGMKWETIGVPPKDAQFLDTRKFQITEIARFYRVPPHMLYEFSGATYSNIEHLSLEFIKYSLSIWLTKWEEHCLLKLLTEQERDRYFFGFLTSAFERADRTTRYNSYKIGREGGWLSVNDIRAEENLNPIDGGDTYLQPLNMQPVGAAGDDNQGGQGDGKKEPDLKPGSPTVPQVDEGDGEGRSISSKAVIKASVRVMTDAAERIMRREANAIERASAKWTDAGSRQAWMDEFAKEHRKFVQDALRPGAESLAELLAIAGGQEKHLDQVVDAAYVRLATIAEENLQETRKIVLSDLLPGDVRNIAGFAAVLPESIRNFGSRSAAAIAAAVECKLKELANNQSVV